MSRASISPARPLPEGGVGQPGDLSHEVGISFLADGGHDLRERQVDLWRCQAGQQRLEQRRWHSEAGTAEVTA